MSDYLVLASNIILFVLALIAFARLMQKRQKKRPRARNQMQVMDERLSAMENELRELDERLKVEREQGF